jgi:mannitol/fructose-specific phosphotransferase system IIA component (Ntr-type)
MIIGAYVMGLALSRTDLKHLIQENLSPVYTFLVPIFFCVMGMMVDMKALCSEKVLIFGAIYTVLAILAKIVGCAIPSLFCGFNLLGSLRIGMGMVPRGEVALIIAGLGLSKGYLTSEVFGIGILMTLITTLIAPPGLVALFIPTKRGVNKPKASMDNSRVVKFELEKKQIADLMLQKLITQFNKEGCFTSLLSSEDQIWHVSMDKLEISLRRNGSCIEIECTPDEEAFVLQAWTEVLSQMNELAQTLAKPIQRNEEFLKDSILNHEDIGKVKENHIFKHISQFVMLPSLKASSKTEAIEKMVNSIVQVHPKSILDQAKVLKSVISREEAMPTGLDHGIAVPHGRTDSVTEILGAIALVDNSNTANGSLPDYETIDHSMVQIIVLTLAPESSSSPYLHLMSNITKILRVKNNCEALLNCKTSAEMYQFFKNTR